MISHKQLGVSIILMANIRSPFTSRFTHWKNTGPVWHKKSMTNTLRSDWWPRHPAQKFKVILRMKKGPKGEKTTRQCTLSTSRPASPPGNSSRSLQTLVNGETVPNGCYFFLVGGFNHLEKYESQWEGLSHILWKIKNV